MKRSSFFQKTLLLIVSNVLTGVFSFIFSIILSRQIGSKGVGLYQLVMPLYSMFLFITGGGITISISKIAAEKKALGNLAELYKTIKVICIFEIVWSVVITALLMTSAGFISANILSDNRTFYSIIAFCPALIIVSISSVYKGAFYGIQRVTEPALIDVVEKIARIVVLYILIRLFNSNLIEVSSASAVLSLSFGELISLILFFICYRNYVKNHPGHGKCDNSFQLCFNILKLALPLSLNGILSTVFSTLITVLIPKRLQLTGMTYENALSLLGKLQGMALTIAFFPTIIIGAMNVLLIPSISEATTFKKDYIINHRMNIAMRIASVTAFSSAAIMLAIPMELGQFFFKDPGVGEILRMIAPAVPIIYIEITSFAILNGLGRQGNLLINSIILSVIDLILIYIFMGIPSLGIKGYAINFTFSGLLGIFLNFRVIKRNFEYSLDKYHTFILPFLCSVMSYIVTSNFLQSYKNIPMVICAAYMLYALLYIPLYSYSKRKK